MEIFIVVFVLITHLFLLYLFSRKNEFNFIHKVFFLMESVTIIWVLLTYFSLTINHPAYFLFLVRMCMFGTLTYAVVFNVFAFNFFNGSNILSRARKTSLTLVYLICSVLTLSPFVFSSFIYTEIGLSPVPGKAIGLWLAGILILNFEGIFQIIYKIQFPPIRKQAILIAIGIISFFILNVSFVFIPVVVMQDRTFVPFSPLFTLPFATLSLFALIRYRLLDIIVAVPTKRIHPFFKNKLNRYWGNIEDRKEWDLGQLLFSPHKRLVKTIHQDFLLLIKEKIPSMHLDGLAFGYRSEKSNYFTVKATGLFKFYKSVMKNSDFTITQDSQMNFLQFSIISKNDCFLLFSSRELENMDIKTYIPELEGWLRVKVFGGITKAV